MENLKTKEKNSNKAKRKMMLISILMTLVIISIIAVIFANLFFENNNENNNYVVPNSYSFSGNILSTCLVYPDIFLAIEEEDNSIYGVTLKNNELISKKVFCSNLDYGLINDFSVILAEYDNNNTKDFVYLYDKVENGYVYKFYSIDNDGNIIELNIENITVNTRKASLKLEKSGDKYEYKVPSFYYDGYKIKAEVGEYQLTEKSDVKEGTVSKTSKIAVEGKYNALPRKVSVLKKVPDYIQNVNKYLLDIEKKQCIEVDTDGDGLKEYIISFTKDNKTYVSLFDSSSNFVVNFISLEGEKDIKEIVEVVDVDNDGIMEIIIIKDGSLEVHRYSNGFYY